MSGDEPIAVDGPHSEDEIDLFGDYRRLLPILVEGRRCFVPEENTVLRALQFLEIKSGAVKMDWPRYCWNDTKGCCEMRYRGEPEGVERTGRACRLPVRAGMEIVVLPKGGRCI